MTRVTLVAGSDAGTREAAIAGRTTVMQQSGVDCAVILEGLPSHAAHFDSAIQVTRIAPGCPCCTGNLTMQVTLNRILRRPPARLFISITDVTHIEAIRNFLTQPSYHKLLVMNDDLLL